MSSELRSYPADYFGRTLVEKLPENKRVGVVSVAVAGAKIELFDERTMKAYVAEEAPDWMNGIIETYEGNPFQYLVKMGKQAKQDGVIKGVLLHQGESNSGDPEWPEKVKYVYEHLLEELDLKAGNVPLIAGELVSEDQGGVCAGMNEIISQLPKTIPTAHAVSLEGCPCHPDQAHFTPEGYRELGKRNAEVVYPLLGE